MYSILIPVNDTAIQIKHDQIGQLLRRSMDNTITLGLFGIGNLNTGNFHGWLIVTDKHLNEWVGSKIGNMVIRFVQTTNGINLYDGAKLVSELTFDEISYWLEYKNTIEE